VSFDPALLAELGPLVRGPLLTSTDAGYDTARSVWNAMIDKRPGVIVRCLGVADVAACVNFARAQGLSLSIKGGGHNIAGLAVADGALTLDMSLMRGVLVDPGARIARAQAGCLLGDVDRETQLHGLAAPLGFVSETGIAGLTLGGGIGYLTKRFGWTSDSVIGIEMVAADGRIVGASETENADLFWALRGGGGNFGVATRFDYRLYPIGPEIVGGAIAWPAEDAPRVLELYRSIVASAPPEFTLVAALRLAPPAPWIRPEAHGKPIVAFFACHTGAIAEAERVVAPIKGFGKPVGDVIQRRTYVSQQNMLDPTQPKGRRYYWKSEYLADGSPDVCAKLIENAAFVSPHSALILFQLGETLGRLPADHSAVGNRDARFVLNITSSWERAEDDAKNVEWARAIWRDMRAFSTGGTYVNFLTEEEGQDRVHAAYGAGYGKLAEVKAAWDPDNLFRVNKNIVPAGG
jgi:FAD/FMN-containing dehydrogenase